MYILSCVKKKRNTTETMKGLKWQSVLPVFNTPKLHMKYAKRAVIQSLLKAEQILCKRVLYTQL